MIKTNVFSILLIFQVTSPQRPFYPAQDHAIQKILHHDRKQSTKRRPATAAIGRANKFGSAIGPSPSLESFQTTKRRPSSSNTTEANGVDINAQRVQYREEDGGGNEGEGLVCVCVCVVCVCPLFLPVVQLTIDTNCHLKPVLSTFFPDLFFRIFCFFFLNCLTLVRHQRARPISSVVHRPLPQRCPQTQPTSAQTSAAIRPHTP